MFVMDRTAICLLGSIKYSILFYSMFCILSRLWESIASPHRSRALRTTGRGCIMRKAINIYREAVTESGNERFNFVNRRKPSSFLSPERLLSV